MSDPAKGPYRGTVSVGHHIACLLDIQGETEWFKELDSLSIDDLAKEPFATKFRKRGAVPDRLREDMKLATSSIEKENPFLLEDSQPLDFAPHPKPDGAYCLNYLSDAIVISASLVNRRHNLSAITRIFHLLRIASAAMARSLANQLVLRGGMEIGVGYWLSATELYGPAIANAHILEKTNAFYPRIVMGDKISRFIDEVLQQEPEDDDAVAAIAMARNCASFRFLDKLPNDHAPDLTRAHSRLALDWLGPAAREYVFSTRFVFGDLVRFVRAEARQIETHPLRELRVKYKCLLQYIASRSSLWPDR